MSPTHRHHTAQRAASESLGRSIAEPAVLIFGAAGTLALAAGQLARLADPSDDEDLATAAATTAGQLAHGAERLARDLAGRPS